MCVGELASFLAPRAYICTTTIRVRARRHKEAARLLATCHGEQPRGARPRPARRADASSARALAGWARGCSKRVLGQATQTQQPRARLSAARQRADARPTARPRPRARARARGQGRGRALAGRAREGSSRPGTGRQQPGARPGTGTQQRDARPGTGRIHGPFLVAAEVEEGEASGGQGGQSPPWTPPTPYGERLRRGRCAPAALRARGGPPVARTTPCGRALGAARREQSRRVDVVARGAGIESTPIRSTHSHRSPRTTPNDAPTRRVAGRPIDVGRPPAVTRSSQMRSAAGLRPRRSANMFVNGPGLVAVF